MPRQHRNSGWFSSPLPFPVLLVFLSCISYWAYLFFHTSMMIVNDSVNYKELGEMLNRYGWSEYLRTGPQREPLYPFIVSVAMRLGDSLGVSYEPVVKLMQLFLLLLSQILMWGIMRKMKIHPYVAAAVIFYYGISPAVVNMALSLYSEVFTFPLVLAAVFLLGKAWQTLTSSSVRARAAFFLGLGCGLIFVLLTFLKGVFEVATLVLITPFLLLAAPCIKKAPGRSRNVFLFLLSFLLIFEGSIFLYKCVNKKFNGHFALTNRGAYILFGNTKRRTQPLTPKQYLVALAYVPGEGFCRSLFTQRDCFYWSYMQSDEYGYAELNKLLALRMPESEVNRLLVKFSVAKVLDHPFKYTLFWGLEGFKMLFWESTQIGFVEYPGWLTALFELTWFKNALRLTAFLLTFPLLSYAAYYVWTRRRMLVREEREESQQAVLTMFWALIFIVFLSGLHAFFFILNRYTVPFASLYLLIIGFSFHHLALRQKT